MWDRSLSLYTNDSFDKFWDEALKQSIELEIDEPKLPRHIRKPVRFRKECDENTKTYNSPKEYYKDIYNKAFDNTIQCLNGVTVFPFI